MTQLPPGAIRNEALRKALDALLAEMAKLRRLLPAINDPQMRAACDALIDYAEPMIRGDRDDLSSAVADHLMLVSDKLALVEIGAESEDEDGPREAIGRLRDARDLVVLATARALRAAQAAGHYAADTPRGADAGPVVPRGQAPARATAEIIERLAAVEAALRKLPEIDPQPAVVNQTALIAFYVRKMRVEIAAARFNLSLDQMIDFGALSRAVTRMGELTGRFASTLKGWGNGVKRAVLDAAYATGETVRRATRKVRATLRAVQWRKADQPLALPPDFDVDNVHQMILRGERPPEEWTPWITQLNFDSAPVANLAPLAGLTGLQMLDLNNTPVADLAPLAGLTGLQTLDLINTRVADLAPLAGMTALQRLTLDNTQIADLAPLAGMTALQRLTLDNTQIADLAPLAGLTGLQTLDLINTRVADLAPLAGMTALQRLTLDNTQIADLAPLAGMTALQRLTLDNTQIADLAPLAGLTGLRMLVLNNTQVADLAPLAGLTDLQRLYLINTRVAYLAPLAGLTGLRTLYLDNTQVADLAPLAGLTDLQTLSLHNTQVADIAQVSHVRWVKLPGSDGYLTPDERKNRAPKSAG